MVTDTSGRRFQPTRFARSCLAGANRERAQPVLLGVNRSCKPFTMAQGHCQTPAPAVILARTKTLAAQLYSEFLNFFPDNAVEYFRLLLHYYQPRAMWRATTLHPRRSRPFQRARSTGCATRPTRFADGARRRHHHRLGVVHLRYRSVETYPHDLPDGGSAPHRPAAIAGRSGCAAIQAREWISSAVRSGCAGEPSNVPAHLEGRGLADLRRLATRIETIAEFDPLTVRKPAICSRSDLRQFALGDATADAEPWRTKARSREESSTALSNSRASGRLIEAQRCSSAPGFDLEMLEATGRLPGHRELLPLPDRPGGRRTAPTRSNYIPRQRALVHRREPCLDSARSAACTGGDFRRKATLRIRLRAAVLSRQPAAAV